MNEGRKAKKRSTPADGGSVNPHSKQSKSVEKALQLPAPSALACPDPVQLHKDIQDKQFDSAAYEELKDKCYDQSRQTDVGEARVRSSRSGRVSSVRQPKGAWVCILDKEAAARDMIDECIEQEDHPQAYR